MELLTYSDASNVGGRDLLFNLVRTSLEGSGWPGSEALCSSSFREIRAIRFVRQSFSGLLVGKECKHRSDIQTVCSILSVSSSKPQSQRERLPFTICAIRQVFVFLQSRIPRYFNFKVIGGVSKPRGFPPLCS